MLLVVREHADARDTNGDQSIDQTELTSFLDYVGEKTGSSIDSASALKALDSDGNGTTGDASVKFAHCP